MLLPKYRANNLGMILNDRFVMTDEEVQQQRKDALFAHEEAKERCNQLILKAHTESRKLFKVANLLANLEADADDPLRAEAPLLSLAPAEYEGIVNMSTIRALANSIAVARRELSEAATAKRLAGFRG